MKAIEFYKFGPPEVFESVEVNEPTPDEHDVIIKTYATSINTVDVVYRNGTKAFFGLSRIGIGIRKPKIHRLGFDIAGRIVKIGENVTDFKIGDRVYGGARSGANAEFAKAKDNKIAMMPSNMSYAEAGVVPVAGLTALQGLRDKGNIEEGEKVLIYGASGGTGTFAVQIAKSYGADVTGVASGKNQSLVKDLGADEFLDYKRVDFTKEQVKYDLIFDAVGKAPLSRWKKALKSDGIYVNVGSPQMPMIRFYSRVFWNRFREQKIYSFLTQYVPEDLQYLSKLSEENKLKTVIDKTFKLDEIIKAHRYYETRRTAGKISVIVKKEKRQ